MKKLYLVVLVAILICAMTIWAQSPAQPVPASLDPCQANTVAKTSVALNHTASAQLVALSGATRIYVCGYWFSTAGTTPSVRFMYGTGAVCATGLVALTGVQLGTPQMSADSGATQFSTAAGNALCMTVAGTSPSIQGYLTYVQQ